MEKFEVFNRVGSFKENVRRNGRYLIELRALRSLLEGFRGIRSVENCEEFVSRMARYPKELGVVLRMLGEMIFI